MHQMASYGVVTEVACYSKFLLHAGTLRRVSGLRLPFSSSAFRFINGIATYFGQLFSKVFCSMPDVERMMYVCILLSYKQRKRYIQQLKSFI